MKAFTFVVVDILYCSYKKIGKNVKKVKRLTSSLKSSASRLPKFSPQSH